MHEIEEWFDADPSGRYAVARTRMAGFETEAGRDRAALALPRRRPRPRIRATFGTWLVRIGTSLLPRIERAGPERPARSGEGR